MRRLVAPTLTLFLSGSLGILGAACGGDDDGDDTADVDSGTDESDAGDGDEADAAPEAELLRSGTIAITDSTVVNTGGAVNGALVLAGYSDAQTGTAPLPGFESPVGGCLITVYEVGTDVESTAVGEGVISVEGTANGPFACAFADAVDDYLCQSTSAAVAGGDAEGGVLNGTAELDTFTLTGAAWPDTMVGMQLMLTGFGLDGALIPIVGVSGDNLVLFGVPTGLAAVGGAGDTYASFVGAGPIPGGFDFLEVGAPVTIAKDETEMVPGFDVTMTPEGEGFTLVDDAEAGQYLPNQIATDGSAIAFACEGDGCGADGTGLIKAMTINGRTTDSALPGEEADPFGTALPPATTSYATFTCSALGMDEVTIPADAMAAILGTDPTRIQLSVGRFVGQIEGNDAGTASSNILLGHNQIGYTTVEDPE